MIHIEGMGLLGSMLARRLLGLERPFTWSDIDTEFAAWPCSTGLAYPSGDEHDMRGLARWQSMLAAVPEAVSVPYVYAHKRPPHGGRYEIARDYGPMRRARPRAVALNVPEFVAATRVQAAECRTDARGRGDTLVVAHPSVRTDGYLWGWAARVRLTLPAWLDDLGDEQPALYAKAHRFNLTYAYPIPGTGQWWAGSTLQHQRLPKRRGAVSVMKLVAEWYGNAADLLGVTVDEMWPPVQGWRPRAFPGDRGHVAYDAGSDTWTMPPMATDGMRRGLLVVDDLMRRAGWAE